MQDCLAWSSQTPILWGLCLSKSHEGSSLLDPLKARPKTTNPSHFSKSLINRRAIAVCCVVLLGPRTSNALPGSTLMDSGTSAGKHDRPVKHGSLSLARFLRSYMQTLHSK